LLTFSIKGDPNVKKRSIFDPRWYIVMKTLRKSAMEFHCHHFSIGGTAC
jgi:hypothetical protein